jgi:hypothetical protein
MNEASRTRAWVISVLLAALLVGCKAKPAPNAGFADPKLMKNDPSVPFNNFWRKPGVNWKHYGKIYVADVDTAYMLKMTDWQKGERKDQIESDVKALGVYTHDSLVKAFRADPTHRFTVMDAATHDSNALVFEMALIEVIPSKVTLNALGYAPFFVGMGVTATRTVINDKSSVAFELRARDAATGEIIMLAADNEAEQQAVVDLRAMTWYGHAHGIIDDWARQWVRVAEQRPGQVIKDTPTFRLQPW